MSASDGWQTARNVLCVRLDAMGDVLMTTPALRALKESRPGRRVTLLTSPVGGRGGGAGARGRRGDRLRGPLDEGHRAPAPTAGPDLAMIERLRAGRFDAAVIFTVYSQNPLPAALLCYLADIPLRLAHCRENPYQLLTDWVARARARARSSATRSAGSSTWSPRSAAGRPTSGCRSASPTRRAGAVDGAAASRPGSTPDGPGSSIHPGATAPSRRYPPEAFAEAARRLVARARLSGRLHGRRRRSATLVEAIRAAMAGAPSHLARRASSTWRSWPP